MIRMSIRRLYPVAGDAVHLHGGPLLHLHHSGIYSRQTFNCPQTVSCEEYGEKYTVAADDKKNSY